MRAVLQPLNEKAKDIIVKHADLLQSTHMEPLLLQLVAHVSAYQVILQRCTAFHYVLRGLVPSVYLGLSGLPAFQGGLLEAVQQRPSACTSISCAGAQISHQRLPAELEARLSSSQGRHEAAMLRAEHLGVGTPQMHVHSHYLWQLAGLSYL